MKFQPNAGLTAKHAYFLISGGTDNVDFAEEYLISEREDVRCRPYPKPGICRGLNAPASEKYRTVVRNLDGLPLKPANVYTYSLTIQMCNSVKIRLYHSRHMEQMTCMIKWLV